MFKQLKINSLIKRKNTSNSDKTTSFKKDSQYTTTLIITDQPETLNDINQQIQFFFPNINVTSLILRDEKIDETSGQQYTFNSKDLGFGKFKNDRLNQLVEIKFDLLIDFTTNSTDLDLFVKICQSELKIGDLNASKNYLYNLLIERAKSPAQFIENIHKQINILNGNGSK